MRRVPSLLVALLGAVSLVCAWVALEVFVDSAPDALRGGTPGVRVSALLMVVAACLLASVAWRLFKSARIWFQIARRVARPR